MAEAGYELRGRQLVSKATGEPLAVEFLGADASTERYVLPYKQALERIGVTATLRIVDAAQYTNRLRGFDFDITTTVWPESLSPGNEQRDFWGSAAADRPGSRNVVGIKDPAIDALIDKVIFAQRPGRARRGDAGARPGAARPQLRRAAVELAGAAHRALEPLRQARDDAGIRQPRLPGDLVVRRGPGGEDGSAAMTGARSQGRPGPDRRTLMAGAAALGAAAVLPAGRSRAAEVESHGLSTFGDLQLPPDFKHLPYVNPNAPKGGTLSLQIKQTVGNQNFDTFNTLHIYVLKGDGAAGMPGTFDTLMAGSGDEPDALYGLVARAVRVSEDKLTYRFLLRPEARFHDGSRLTARDVAFSLDVLKAKGHPTFRTILSELASAEAESDDVLLRALRPEPQPRHPPHGGGPADLLGGVVARPRVRLRDARSAPRLGPLQGRPLRAGPLHRVRPRAGLLGPGPARRRRPEQLRPHPLRVLSRPLRRLRGLQVRHLHLPRGVHLADLAQGLRVPGLSRGPGQARDDRAPGAGPARAQGAAPGRVVGLRLPGRRGPAGGGARRGRRGGAGRGRGR